MSPKKAVAIAWTSASVSSLIISKSMVAFLSVALVSSQREPRRLMLASPFSMGVFTFRTLTISVVAGAPAGPR